MGQRVGKIMPSKVALDTNIFIYYFDKKSIFHTQAKKVFSEIHENTSQVIVSMVTYTELLSYPYLSQKEISAYVTFFEQNELIDLKNLDLKTARTTAVLRRKYHLKTPDAVILASAIANKAEVFITADERLKKVKEIEVFVLS